MLAGKRRLGKTLLERHIVYDLIEDSRPIGFIEYSANRDRIEIRSQSYSIALEREPMTLLEQVAKLLTWRWKDIFALRDDAGRLIATSEKSALNMFSLHHEGAIFSMRPRGRGYLEVCRQLDGVAIGGVAYPGTGRFGDGVVIAAGMGACAAGFRHVDAPFLRPARTPHRQ